MRAIVLAGAILAVAACQKQPTALEQAEKRYAFLKSRAAMPGELCRAAGAAKEAAFDAAVKADTADEKREAELDHAIWSIRVLTDCG